MRLQCRCSRSSRSLGRLPIRRSFDGLLLTSANAVRAGGRRTSGAAAVSRSMRSAARPPTRRAMPDSTSRPQGDAGVDELLGSIDRTVEVASLVAGKTVKQPHDARQQITPVPVYRSKPIASPELWAEGAVVLIHSPRAGRRFAELVSDRGSIAIAAISTAAAAASAMAGKGSSNVRIGQPTKRCWPSPHGCATTRTRNERDQHANGMGRAAAGRLVLILLGAAAAVWGSGALSARGALSRHRPGTPPVSLTPKASNNQPSSAAAPTAAPAADNGRLAELETRVERVENATSGREGSAGRADALVVAFAARRAIDRGVALGYLENLLVERFGTQHQRRRRDDHHRFAPAGSPQRSHRRI